MGEAPVAKKITGVKHGANRNINAGLLCKISAVAVVAISAGLYVTGSSVLHMVLLKYYAMASIQCR